MTFRLFHVYRNTPLGRETLRQAADFSRRINGKLQVYLPKFDRFLFHFESRAVEIRLDESYLYLPDTAESKMREVTQELGVPVHLVEISSMTASNLPRLPTDFDLLSLPRVMVERSGKIDLGAVGTGVRQLVKNAHAPALIAPGRFHDWSEILVLFGGSEYSVVALQWGLAVAQRTGVPIKILTVSENSRGREYYEKILVDHGIDQEEIADWIFLKGQNPLAMLNEIPRTAMIIMGAYGHGRLYARLFGSKTELIQKNTANLIMMIGEHCQPPRLTKKLS